MIYKKITPSKKAHIYKHYILRGSVHPQMVHILSSMHVSSTIISRPQAMHINHNYLNMITRSEQKSERNKEWIHIRIMFRKSAIAVFVTESQTTSITKDLPSYLHAISSIPGVT